MHGLKTLARGLSFPISVFRKKDRTNYELGISEPAMQDTIKGRRAYLWSNPHFMRTGFPGSGERFLEALRRESSHSSHVQARFR